MYLAYDLTLKPSDYRQFITNTPYLELTFSMSTSANYVKHSTASMAGMQQGK